MVCKLTVDRLAAENLDCKQGNTSMAPQNASLNQLKQSLKLKTESWFEELKFSGLTRGKLVFWGEGNLILYVGVNVSGGGMWVWRWGFWTTGPSPLEAPTVLP